MDPNFLILNLAIVTIFCIAASAALRRNGFGAFSTVFVSALAISFVGTVAMYGMGQLSDIRIVLGKILAMLIALSAPLAMASLPIISLNKSNVRPVFISVISLVLGYLGITTIPFIGIMLVCIFTGDCL